MDRILESLPGRKVQAYVVDMVVFSEKVDLHSDDLAKPFTTINKYSLKLNLKK